MSLHLADQEELKPEWKARLQDPLSLATRGERRLLLLVSTVSLIIVVLGLFPTKIEALGIAFESADRAQMIFLLAAVNTYSLIGFVIYAWGDLHLLFRSYGATTTGDINYMLSGKATKMETFNFVIRFVFDFVVPIGYGCYALHRLYLVLHLPH